MATKKEEIIPDLTDLVHSSIRQIEEFERSSVGQDIVRVIEDWEKGLKTDYDKAEDFGDLRFFQGISVCLEYMKRLPDAMKTIVELKAEGKPAEASDK